MDNEQIARDVMGWTTRKEWHGVNYFNSSGIQEFYHDFLNDHNAAMMVVEKMLEDGYYLRMLTLPPHHFECEYSEYDPDTGNWYSHESVTNEHMCHAICAAALKAKGK